MSEYDLSNSPISKHVEPFSNLIWDWNGTLIDDVEIAVKSVTTLLRENGLPEVEVQHYRKVFRFPIKDYYKDIGFDLSKACFEKLCVRFHEEYNKNKLESGKLFDDTVVHLDFFSQSKNMSILSAGAQWHLSRWVDHFGISHYFEHIFGINDHYASCKIERGQQLMKESGYLPQDTILIGDTDHDLAVGKALGVEVLLIAQGHQCFERLSSLHHKVIKDRQPSRMNSI